MASTLQQALQNALQHHQAGQLAPAEALYRQILAQDPNHAQALHMLGVLAYQVGRNDRAVDLISRSIVLNPNAPEAHSNLGNALKNLGQFDQAIAAFRKAISLNPNFADAYYNLGNALKDQGQLDQAITALRQSLALNPNNPGACNNLGVVLQGEGQLDRAITAFRQAIALLPQAPDSHRNLGLALMDKGLLDEAIIEFTKAIQLHPDNAPAHFHLGNALKQKEQFSDALLSYRRALALRPNDIPTHEALGATLLLLHDIPAAEASFRQSLTQAPNSAILWTGLGTALKFQGRFNEAADCFRHALTINPDASAYRDLISTGRQVADPVEIHRLTELLNQPSLSMDDRITAEFALGKLLDETDRYDEAFTHFAIANSFFKQACAAAGERFDAADLHRTVDQLIGTFTSPFFAARQAWGDPSQVPVFIVGMPRSGTSLVEQIAASQPAVFGASELYDIENLALAMPGSQPGTGHAAGRAMPFLWTSPSIAHAARTYLEHLRAMSGTAQRITDKMPGNIFHLGLIALLFPKAHIIFCRRDPRDTCLSCYFEHFSRHNIVYSYDLADTARQQVETDRLTTHWLKTLPLRMLEVQYETLVTDQEAQSRRLIEFLGLPWDPVCLDFHCTSRPVLTASFWQVRQPIYTRSVGRWRHYQQHLGPMLEILGLQE